MTKKKNVTLQEKARTDGYERTGRICRFDIFGSVGRSKVIVFLP